jgi:6-phosphogluconolactonase
LELAMDSGKDERAVGVAPDPLPPEAPVNRVTLTGAAIGAARTAILVIRGAKKREVLETAIDLGGTSAYPVGRVLDKIVVPVDIYCLDD